MVRDRGNPCIVVVFFQNVSRVTFILSEDVRLLSARNSMLYFQLSPVLTIYRFPWLYKLHRYGISATSYM